MSFVVGVFVNFFECRVYVFCFDRWLVFDFLDEMILLSELRVKSMVVLIVD